MATVHVRFWYRPRLEELEARLPPGAVLDWVQSPAFGPFFLNDAFLGDTPAARETPAGPATTTRARHVPDTGPWPEPAAGDTAYRPAAAAPPAVTTFAAPPAATEFDLFKESADDLLAAARSRPAGRDGTGQPAVSADEFRRMTIPHSTTVSPVPTVAVSNPAPAAA